MNSFSFWSPTKILFGRDSVQGVGGLVRDCGGTHVLIVYGGQSAVKSGLLDRVCRSLGEAGIRCESTGGITPNPRLQSVNSILEAYADRGIDFVLGLGGGSAIDAAKSVAAGLANPGVPVWDFFCCQRPLTACLPVGAIPTLSAAGSETSDSAVLTNLETGIKRGLSSPLNVPRFAVMDPALTYTLPARQTACGVTDILMHTLERYFGPDTDNAVTDALAEALLRVVIEYGPIALEKPDDYKARSELMWASSLSHNGLTGLGQTRDFSVHQLGHVLSAKFDLPHGESLSALWPAWAAFVLEVSPARFAKYARNVWGVTEPDEGKAALAGIEATRDYLRALGMPVTMGQAVGIQTEEGIDELARLCSYERTRSVGAFRPLDYDALRGVYRAANTL